MTQRYDCNQEESVKCQHYWKEIKRKKSKFTISFSQKNKTIDIERIENEREILKRDEIVEVTTIRGDLVKQDTNLK